MKHLDPETIEHFRQLDGGGPPEFLFELIDAYLKDSGPKVDRLQRAWRDRNAPSLATIAHSLKGSSGNIGASALSGHCSTIEKAARSGSLDGLEPAMEALLAEFRGVVAELEILRRGGTPP